MGKGKRNRKIREQARLVNPFHIRKIARRIRKNRAHNHDVTKGLDR